MSHSDSEETSEASFVSSGPSAASSTMSLNQSPLMKETEEMACTMDMSTMTNTPTVSRTPLPTLLESIGNGPNGLHFGTSTTLLSPVSISSYSPQPHHHHQLDSHLEAGLQSPNSSSPFNSTALSFDSATFDQHQPPPPPPSLSSITTDPTITTTTLPHLTNLSTLTVGGVHGCPRVDLLSSNSMAADGGLLQHQTLLPPALTLERLDTHLQLKFEPYNSFRLSDGDCTPDDEEILDYISLWQDH